MKCRSNYKKSGVCSTSGISHSKKLWLSLILSFICATLLCCAFFVPFKNNKTAEAYSAANINSSAVIVPELVLDSYKNGSDTSYAFNANNLRNLYKKLTGNANTASFNDVSNLILNVQSSNTKAGKFVPSGLPSALDAQDFRDKNSGKDIIVEFGGYQWSAMYLTRAREKTAGQNDGDVILTLWLANTDRNTVKTSYWGFVTSESISVAYPRSMYSTSYIHTYVLNNGGGYANAAGTGTTTVAQSASNEWAKFTMSSVTGSLKSYIVTPAQVQYQESESWAGGYGAEANNPNDAYVYPYAKSDANKYFETDVDITSNSHYGDWKNSSLWLPSTTEGSTIALGVSKRESYGLWYASVNQRINNSSTGTTDCTWARGAAGKYALYWSTEAKCGGWGEAKNSAYEKSYAVRPALHLNLTAAEAASLLKVDEPSVDNATAVFDSNGNTFKFTYDQANVEVDSVIYKDSENNETDVTSTCTVKTDGTCKITRGAGTYTFTFKIKAGCAAVWDLATKDKSEKTVPVTITKKKITPPTADTTEFKYTGGSLTYNPNGFDSSAMTISGNTATNVGSSTVTVTLKDGHEWSDGATEADGTTPKIYTFNFTIGKGTPTVNPSYTAVEKRYTADGLPALTNSGTVGTFTWKDDATPTVGTNSYAYIFTPTDTDNWDTYEGTIEITYVQPTISSITAAVKDGETIYDIYTADSIKSRLVVTATYDDNTTHPVLSADYTVSIPNNSGKLVAGAADNKLVIRENGSNKIFNLILSEVIEAKIDSFVVVLLDNYTFTYPVQESDIIGALSDVMVKWNYSPDTAVDMSEDDYGILTVVGTLDAGTQTIKLKSGDVESEGIEITINKGTYEINATLADDTVKYDGQAHGLEISGTLPEGVTAVYHYECAANGYSSAEKPTNAGEYTLTVSFTHENGNYNAITQTKTATLTIEKVKLTITAKDKEITYGDSAANDGVTYSGFISGEDESVLSGTLAYSYGEYASGKDVGEYEIEISGLEAANYEIEYVSGKLTVVPKEITLTIKDSGHKQGEEAVTEYSFVQPAEGVLVGEDTLAVINGVTFTVKDGTGATIELGTQIAEGEYSITAADGIYGNYKITFVSGKYEVTAGDDNTELENKKAAAKAELEKTAQAKREEIDASDLSDEEKAEKKAQVEAELEKGNAAIDSATGVSEVDKAYGEAKKSIEDIRFGFGGGFNIADWWWIFVIVGVVLLIIILVVVIVVVKKRKAATAGYDDYYDDDYDYEDENDSEEYDGEEYDDGDDGDEEIIIEDDE